MLKENQVVEVLPDGTIYYFDLNVCSDEACKLLDELYTKETTVPNFDFSAGVHALLVNAIHILVDSGWTPEDLVEEVLIHTQETWDDEM